MQLQLTGISPRIDGCSSLIAQKAYKSYQRLPQHHKRWLDPEDLLQESLMAALTMERKYRTDQHTKFSSYLYTGLDNHLIHVATALNQKKRSLPDGQVVELDAPVPGTHGGKNDDGVIGDLGMGCTQDAQTDCVKSFVALCRAVSQAAIVVLVRGFLFSDCRRSTPAIYQEIGNMTRKLGIGISVFSYLGSDEKIRRNCLTRVAKDVLMDSGTEANLRCLECTECTGQFSLDAVRDGRFFVSTMTCRGCYRKMQAQPSELNCFGKLKQVGQEGYSEEDAECRIHCPDRKVCRTLSKQGVYMAKKVETKAAKVSTKVTKAVTEGKPKKVAKSVEDVDFDDVEGTVTETKPKATKTKAGKVTKEEKPKRAKKEAVEEEGVPVPEGMVKWPFKRGSIMQYLFQRMYEGVSVTELKKAFFDYSKQGVAKPDEDRIERAWKFMVAVMRRGYGGTGHTSNHTFKLNEDGGRFKITNVKYQPGSPSWKTPQSRVEKVLAAAKAGASETGKASKKAKPVVEEEEESDESDE